LQEDGHCHVHLHSLLVEQRRDAILEELQSTVDGGLHRTGQRGAFACGQHIRVAVHRLFDELIFAAAVIFLIPPLYFCGCFIRHTEVQPVFIFAHNSLQSAVRHACFR